MHTAILAVDGRWQLIQPFRKPGVVQGFFGVDLKFSADPAGMLATKSTPHSWSRPYQWTYSHWWDRLPDISI
jgi:hypothetical protein